MILESPYPHIDCREQMPNILIIIIIQQIVASPQYAINLLLIYGFVPVILSRNFARSDCQVGFAKIIPMTATCRAHPPP